MKVKIIAIGNKLMMDDGIGVKVANKINNEIRDDGIEIIIGETDYGYCLSKINNGDFIVIIDSAYFGKSPGSISLIPLEKLKSYSKNFFSQHETSLIQMLDIYKKKVKGWVIGIEIGKVDFGLNLSESLESIFDDICIDVKKIIKEIMEGVKNA